MTTGDWVRTRKPRPSARLNLVCLPHAGGSASFYREWGERLPGEVEVHVVQYPGREDRLAEPCVETMTALADAVSSVVRPLFARPTVLFGHSMGASLMYEVTKRLEADGVLPELLIASGHPAPHRRKPKDLHRQGDDALVAELKRFSTTGVAALESPELREMLMPMIRADYQVIETYTVTDPARVRAPIAVFRGAEDPDVSEEQAKAWRELSADGEIRHHRVFGGGHMYLQEHQNEVLGAIASLVGVPAPVAGAVAK